MSGYVDESLSLWRWWLAELGGLLPGWLRRRFATAVVLAEPAGDGFRFTVERGDSHRPVDAPPAGLPVWLVLPPGSVLTRRLDWPALPAADLARAARLDLDRQTPCPAEALYYDVAVLARDARARRLSVALAVARAEPVEAWRASLERVVGRPVERVVAAPLPGFPRFHLLPGGAEPPPRRLGLPRDVRARLALACVIAAGVNLWLWESAEEAGVARLEAAVAEARQAAGGAAARRAELAQRQRLLEGFRERQAQGSLLAVLDELTRLLPDGVWLDRVELREGGIQVSGHAPAAAALVPLLEGSALFAEAQFRSPVVADRARGVERFDLAIALRRRS
jgi:general secretion pathway protein L